MRITFNDIDCTLDLSGALLWPAEKTLIVADVHLEKSSSYAEAGVLLPPYDTTASLQTLKRLIAETKAARVICLGDSFHDSQGGERIAPENMKLLRAMTDKVDWIWVVGNHDPDLPEHLGGAVVHDFCLGALTLRHIADSAAAPGEISGHYHPKATVETRGRRVTRPCFVFDQTRLMLPAFGAFTGGLNVRDAAISGLFPNGYDVVMLGTDKLHRFRMEKAA